MRHENMPVVQSPRCIAMRANTVHVGCSKMPNKKKHDVGRHSPFPQYIFERFINFLDYDAHEKVPVVYLRTNFTPYNSSESQPPALESTQQYYADTSVYSSHPALVHLSVSFTGSSLRQATSDDSNNEMPVNTHHDIERFFDAHAPLRLEEIKRVLVCVDVAPWVLNEHLHRRTVRCLSRT